MSVCVQMSVWVFVFRCQCQCLCSDVSVCSDVRVCLDISVCSHVSVGVCVQILADVLVNLHTEGLPDPFYQPVHTFILNPKSITMDELYGGIDKLTMEWHDGLMGITVRNAVQVCGLCCGC